MLPCWRWLLIFTLILTMPSLEEAINNPQLIKTKTFLTPLFTSSPGSVIEKFYYNINFPKGHIAIKSFNVEVVDESSNPISLFDTYLHHWAIVRYYQHKNTTEQNPSTDVSFTQLQEPGFIVAANDGICQRNAFPQYYGTGADSRKTSTFLPNPYGIEVGNEDEVPSGGYEEKWCLNVHAIDTRGVEDRLGCIECRCDLYNVTEDRNGAALGEDYRGGLRCCYDKTECRVREGYEMGDDDVKRNLYVRYVVKWVDWDEDLVIPVKVYIFDVTDTWKPSTSTDSIAGPPEEHNCLVEYNVECCSSSTKSNGEDDDDCNATKMMRVIFPESGYLIYGMAHLHIGGIGAMLYGEDGRLLCSSSPIYGDGSEVGNEDGYVVGMSTCYPQMKINSNEMLSFVSKYDPTQTHIGVMGLFHIMVAHKLPNQQEPLQAAAGDTTM